MNELRALAAAIFLLVAAQPSLAQDAAISLSEPVITVGKTVTVVVSGSAAIPDGARVDVFLNFSGARLGSSYGFAKSRSFSATFTFPKDKFASGSYEVQARFRLNRQPKTVKKQMPKGVTIAPATRLFKFGNDAAAAKHSAEVKAKLVDKMASLREIFVDLNQRATYYISDLQLRHLNAKVKAAGAKERAKRKKAIPAHGKRLIGEWKRMTSDLWSTRFAAAKYDYKQFQASLAQDPLPEATAKVKEVIDTLELWYGSVNRALYKLAMQTVPDKLKGGSEYPPQQLAQGVIRSSIEVYKRLGIPGSDVESWNLSSLAEPEEGRMDDDKIWYESFVTKFKIRRPDDWIWDFNSTSPSHRLRIVPKGTMKSGGRLSSEVSISVEILDYVAAEDYKDLTKLSLARTRGRWGPSYKEESAERMSVPDETMRSGLRAGLKKIFTVVVDRPGETKGATVKKVYKFIDYELYCRWHKRTYGVIVVCPEAEFVRWEPIFRQICASFAVLDDPKYKQRAAHEKAEMKKAEAAKNGGKKSPEAEPKDSKKAKAKDGKKAKAKDGKKAKDSKKVKAKDGKKAKAKKSK